MKILKRGALVAAMAAASVAMLASTASATIRPLGYSTSSASGVFNTITLAGTSSCDLSNVAINTNATGTGGTVTAATVSNCGGVLSDGSYNLGSTRPITISVTLGSPSTVTANVNLLISNILGGECLYAGTMTGSANGTGTVTVAGSMSLVTNLNGGFCSNPARADLTITLPGATIS